MKPILLFNNREAEYQQLSMQLVFVNPMFSENKFNTSYSYSFELPYSPVNQTVFGYKNRFDTAKKTEYAFRLVSGCGILMEGIATASVSNSDKIVVSVVSQGVRFAQLAIGKNLKDIPMDTIPVFDEAADDTTTKINAWTTHMFQCNYADEPTTGSHKFPMIFTAGYSGDYGWSKNPIHERNRHVVNALAEGTFVQSWGVLDEDKTTPEDKYWPFTVAPCPRTAYVFQKVFDFYGVTRIDGALWTDAEMNQMVMFAGVVADQDVRGGTNWKINVHGPEINLANFVPDTKVIDLFNLLSEVYGAYYSMPASGKMIIRTVRDTLSKHAIDISSWYADDQSYESAADEYPHIFYEVANENNIKKVLLPTWDYLVTGPNDFQTDDSEKPINPLPDQVNQEYELKHFPMKSNFFATEGFVHDRAQYLSGEDFNRRGYGELMPRFIFPYGIMSLGDSDSDYRQQRFHVGYYRGVAETRQVHPVEGVDTEETWSTCWPYSYGSTRWDSRNTSVPFMHQFGTSLYLNTTDGTYQNYLLQYYDIVNGDTITRTLNAPEHVLMKLIDFDLIKHTIQDKRGSVTAYLYSIEMTITEDGITGSVAHYKVPKETVLSENL